MEDSYKKDCTGDLSDTVSSTQICVTVNMEEEGVSGMSQEAFLALFNLIPTAKAEVIKANIAADTRVYKPVFTYKAWKRANKRKYVMRKPRKPAKEKTTKPATAKDSPAMDILSTITYVPSDDKPHQCGICSYKAKRKAALISHLLSLHNKNSELSNTPRQCANKRRQNKDPLNVPKAKIFKPHETTSCSRTDTWLSDHTYAKTAEEPSGEHRVGKQAKRTKKKSSWLTDLPDDTLHEASPLNSI